MNVLQYFHKKQDLPPFKIGERVVLKKGAKWEQVRLMYNHHYPNCFVDYSKWHTTVWEDLNATIGDGVHTVTGVEEGTPAAGGWFVSVDNKETAYHGNIFERENC